MGFDWIKQGRSQNFSKGEGRSQRLLTAALPRVSAGSVVLSRLEGPYELKTRAVDENTLQKTNLKKVGFSTMAFTAKILSWRFRHLNIVGCLVFYVISMEFLSLTRRLSLSRNVPSGEERGETAVFAG